MLIIEEVKVLKMKLFEWLAAATERYADAVERESRKHEKDD